MVVERINEDMMNKLGDLKMTRDAIQGTIDFTQKSLMSLSGGGGAVPKVTPKDSVRLVDSVQEAHAGQVSNLNTYNQHHSFNYKYILTRYIFFSAEGHPIKSRAECTESRWIPQECAF